MTKRKLKFGTLRGLLRNLGTVRIYAPDKDAKTLLPMLYVPGQGKLLLVLGDNATGKSLVRRSLCLLCQDAGIESIPISMHGRSTTFLRGFIYGDESYQSTGEISAATVLKGISTCQTRTSAHIMIWDEPDLGMSEEYSQAAGIEIYRLAQNPPEHTVAIVVSSHSRYLVRELLPLHPHYICMGKTPPPTLEAWLKRPMKPRSLQTLIDSSRRMQQRFFALERKIRDEEQNKRKRGST